MAPREKVNSPSVTPSAAAVAGIELESNGVSESAVIPYFEMAFCERAQGKRASMSVFWARWDGICGHRFDPGPAAAQHIADDQVTFSFKTIHQWP